MSNVTELAKALSDVHLGDLIGECVITFKDDKAHIMSMDLTSSLFVQTSAEIEHENSQVGIANLALFVKYLNTIKDAEVSIKQKENVLVIRQKAGATVKYLLAEVDLIPSFDEEWEDDILDNELSKFDAGLPLTQEAVSKFMGVMSLFAPNSVYFEISKKGVVTVHGGRKTDHQFDVTLGKLKDAEPCKIKVYGKHITPIFAAIDFNTNPELFLQENEAIIVNTESTSWMLQPISEE